MVNPLPLTILWHLCDMSRVTSISLSRNTLLNRSHQNSRCFNNNRHRVQHFNTSRPDSTDPSILRLVSPQLSSSKIDVKKILTSVVELSPKRNKKVSDVILLQNLVNLIRSSPEVRFQIWEAEGVVPKLIELQDCGFDKLEQQSRLGLSLLGYAPPYSGRGLRILSIDGGGTRGLIPIIILKHIEKICNRPIHKLFDFVCGTSTGSVVTALLFLEKVSTRECERYYKKFSREVFKMNNLLGVSQFFMNHAFYDAKLLEKAIRQFDSVNCPIYETSLHRGIPRMCTVSTIANQSVVEPFLFCNYQHRPQKPERSYYYQCTCEVQYWEALMASTAAPGFFEEVKLRENIFLDGGILTNNPCGVAIHEAQLLWGRDVPIQTIISLGSGLYRKSDNKISSTSLKDKIIKIVAGATDTEAVHTILQDVYQPSVYYRFQPELSEDITIDESKPEKLKMLCEDAEKYVSMNKELIIEASASLLAEKKPGQKLQMWLDSSWNRIAKNINPSLYKL